MAWDVHYTDDFAQWWDTLSIKEQAAVGYGVGEIENNGPNLGRPLVDTVNGSRHANMKELRAQAGGKPLRVFFAFDPRRSAILLLGGDKSGDKRFYERLIPVADDLYDAYLRELQSEGLI